MYVRFGWRKLRKEMVFLKLFILLMGLLAACASQSGQNVLGPAAPVIIDLRIAASTDDVEEQSDGSVNQNSSDLEFVIDGSAQKVIGLRFNDLNIPRGAIINKAYLQFKTDETTSGTTSLTIKGQAANTAEAFTTASQNVSSRATTSAAISWSPKAWTVVGEAGLAQRSPDISAIIQEIVNRSGWVDANALAILISGSGARVAESFDGDAAGATMLHIEYTSATLGNQAPVVKAGLDKNIALNASVSLAGKVTDDGLPNNTLSTKWLQVSGPGTTTFANAKSLNTTATFSKVGSYVLRLRATDSELVGRDEVTITVSGNSNVTLPARAAFYYPWFPETWTVNGKHVFYHPTAGYYDSSVQAKVDQHIKDLDYAKVKVAIASWWGVNTHKEQTRIPLLFSRTQALGSKLKWSFYYEKEAGANPTVTELQNDLAYIKTNYASSPAYAKVAGKPVIFVYNANDASCDVANRWMQAAAGQWYVVLKVFPSYKNCTTQPSSWHQYSPVVAADQQAGYSFVISPGFWRADEATARLARDLTRWQKNVRDMVASNEPWQLITTFNEWGEGTATESATEWNNAYLDALAKDGVVTPTINVSLNPASATLAKSQTLSFTATVTGSSNTSVTWSASGGTVTGSGNTVTYKAPNTTGTYTLTATSVANTSKKASATITVSTSSNTITIAAAGDISCDPASGSFNGGNGTADSCHMKATLNLIKSINPTAVLTLGDNQYEDATPSQFQNSYALIWGQVKNITYPAAGNHDYHTSGASGYFQYFGAKAGDPTKGYYSFNLGGWHIIALNSNCGAVGGCSLGSPQEKWLRADLAANPTACTLAYWHHPRFSSGEHGDNTSMTALWQTLDAGGADVALSGHDHDYERFAPQTASGVADSNGVRQFVVGTGGKNHYAIGTLRPNSQAHNDDTYGVLKLTLNATGYAWQFVPEAGRTYTDSGTASCR